jgi:hypothetical protein
MDWLFIIKRKMKGIYFIFFEFFSFFFSLTFKKEI